MKKTYFVSLILVLGLFISTSFAAVSHKGIILDGYQEGCTIQVQNAAYKESEVYDCALSRLLFPGYKVVKNPDLKALRIKWAPYAMGEIKDSTTLLVVFNPPQKKKDILSQILEYMGFVKTSRSIFSGATAYRESISNKMVAGTLSTSALGISAFATDGMPMQGYASNMKKLYPVDLSTVLPRQAVDFYWYNKEGENIIFEDGRGTEIFRRQVENLTNLSLTPEDIGMKSGEAYTWHITGLRDFKKHRIEILELESYHQVLSDLKEIDMDKELANSTEKALKKAAYLNFLSDTYPDKINLYWLSYQILKGINEDTLGPEDKRLREALIANCRKR